MSNFLYNKWLDENITDLPDFLLRHGVEGLLTAFERWLKANRNLQIIRCNLCQHSQITTGENCRADFYSVKCSHPECGYVYSGTDAKSGWGDRVCAGFFEIKKV